jgi:hypothetical protein
MRTNGETNVINGANLPKTPELDSTHQHPTCDESRAKQNLLYHTVFHLVRFLRRLAGFGFHWLWK